MWPLLGAFLTLQSVGYFCLASLDRSPLHLSLGILTGGLGLWCVSS